MGPVGRSRRSSRTVGLLAGLEERVSVDLNAGLGEGIPLV